MKNCLQCDAELTHVPGRKEKSFCNSTCRNKYFYEQSKKGKEAANSAAFEKAIEAALPPTEVIKAAIEDMVVFGHAITHTDSDGKMTRIDPTSDKADILRQIAAIQDEKIPEHRNKSHMGRQSWKLDQQKRINALKAQL